MSFWKSELGEITGKEEDAFIKDFTAIPNNTKALAKIVVCINATEKPFNGAAEFPYIHIDWQITEGEFKGQKIKQKVKVFGDPNKQTSENIKFKALNMLKLIYNIFNHKPKDANPPPDQDLAFFCGKIAGIKIKEMANYNKEKGQVYRSNWVSEVASSNGFVPEVGVSIPDPVPAKDDSSDYSKRRANEDFLASATDTRPQAAEPELDDDIPF